MSVRIAKRATSTAPSMTNGSLLPASPSKIGVPSVRRRPSSRSSRCRSRSSPRRGCRRGSPAPPAATRRRASAARPTAPSFGRVAHRGRHAIEPGDRVLDDRQQPVEKEGDDRRARTEAEHRHRQRQYRGRRKGLADRRQRPAIGRKSRPTGRVTKIPRPTPIRIDAALAAATSPACDSHNSTKLARENTGSPTSGKAHANTGRSAGMPKSSATNRVLSQSIGFASNRKSRMLLLSNPEPKNTDPCI